MNSIFILAKQAIRKLEQAYMSGSISYPRVFNDYMNVNDMKFYEYPHPPLKEFDLHSKPLKRELYSVDKATIPLFLAQSGITTPSTLIKTFETIDKYFDDDMQLRRENDLDMEADIILLGELMQEMADEIQANDIARNKKSSQETSSLLEILDKEGDIWSGFKMEIMPYRIELSVNATEEENLEEEEKKIPFKKISNPNKNLSPNITKKTPMIFSSIDDLLTIESFRKEYLEKKTKLDTIIIEKKIARENRSMNEF